MTTDERYAPPERSGRVVAIAFVVLAAAVAAYFALDMPGMDHGGSMADSGEDSRDALAALAPAAFADRLDDPGTFVVNVHVPDEGTIDGTDATIPFDQIVGDGRLPAAKGTALLLYCKTGRMSASAGRALLEVGFTDVSHLEGGMEAWVRAGYALAPG